MSSTQSFLRQRVVGTTVLAKPTTTLYQFVAGAGNYVGNYPPGYMVAAGAENTTATVARDMGKTIFAGISTDSGVTVAAAGFFREIQLLAPVSVASATASTNFGVLGSAPSASNVGAAGYNTYYVPTVVNGVLPAGATTIINNAFPLLGGQL